MSKEYGGNDLDSGYNDNENSEEKLTDKFYGNNSNVESSDAKSSTADKSEFKDSNENKKSDLKTQNVSFERNCVPKKKYMKIETIKKKKKLKELKKKALYKNKNKRKINIEDKCFNKEVLPKAKEKNNINEIANKKEILNEKININPNDNKNNDPTNKECNVNCVLSNNDNKKQDEEQKEIDILIKVNNINSSFSKNPSSDERINFEEYKPPSSNRYQYYPNIGDIVINEQNSHCIHYIGSTSTIHASNKDNT